MGGAFTALVESSEAPAYNTAGLALLNKSEIRSSSFQFFGGDVTRFAIDASRPAWDGVIGFNYIQEGVSDIPYTRDNGQSQPETYGSFNYAQRLFNFAFAKEIVPGQTYAGINVKYLTAELATSNASGFGIDAGVLYRISKELNTGLSIKNIFPTNLSWNGGSADEVPLKVIAGLGYETLIFDKKVLIGVDLDLINKNRSSKLAYGSEITLWQRDQSVIALRVGKNSIEKLTMGIGLTYKNYILDIAILDHDLGSSTLVSLGVLI